MQKSNQKQSLSAPNKQSKKNEKDLVQLKEKPKGSLPKKASTTVKPRPVAPAVKVVHRASPAPVPPRVIVTKVPAGPSKRRAFTLPLSAPVTPKPASIVPLTIEEEDGEDTHRAYNYDPDDPASKEDIEKILDEFHRNRLLHAWDFTNTGLGISGSLLNAWNSWVNTGDDRGILSSMHGMSGNDAKTVLSHLFTGGHSTRTKGEFARLASMTHFAPASIGTTIKGSTGVQVSAWTHPDYGPAVKMSAKIPIAVVRQTAGALTVSQLGTANWILNGLKIGPDSIGGRAASLAAFWSRWSGDRFDIDYIPGVPTSAPGSIILASTNDPAASPASIGTVEAALQCQPSVMTPVWQPSSLRVRGHAEDPLLYTEATTADGSDEARFTAMGLLVVVGIGLDTTQLTPQYLGCITVTFEFDLFSPVPNNGITKFVDLQRSIGAYNSEHLMDVLNDPIQRDRILEFLGVDTGPQTPAEVKLTQYLRDYKAHIKLITKK